ncbi:MAG: class I SAM-dependent methyltransferase [Bacteroidota bacterium]|jgi:SAM-dependent methyltransferase
MATLLPHKFKYLRSKFRNKSFVLLDVGAGSNSPTTTKKFFPKCEYHGIDRGNYRNSDADFKAMDAYYEMDLTELKFDQIPNDFFDVIIMSHVIEHLHNGDQVIQGLIPKLKKGGYIYIEYPGLRSTKLPSMRNTLNFYDDPTHVRLYTVKEVSQILQQSGCSILHSGTRRYWPFIVLLPLTLVSETLKHGFVPGGVFWDLLGFAEYVFAQKE